MFKRSFWSLIWPYLNPSTQKVSNAQKHFGLKYKPSVLTLPDEIALAVFDTGNIVGDFCLSTFSKWKRSAIFKKLWWDDSYYKAVVWWWNRKYLWSYFNFSGILIMVDILTISNNEVSVYEVKKFLRSKRYLFTWCIYSVLCT